jgi:CRP-like cAMP-binding protein
MMNDALERKLSGFFALSEPIARMLTGLCEEARTFEAGEVLVEQGARYNHIWLVESGWVVRARAMPNGARQIVNLALPGDFVGLNALIFDASDFLHSCRTQVTAFAMTPQRFNDAVGREPALMAAMFWANGHEESLLAERIVSLGRRTARQRAAHVLCEFMARLEIIGADDPAHFIIPLSQEDFADILGISIVHTNKVLRSLHHDGVVEFRLGMLHVHDRAALQRIAGFENGYLHFTKRL